MHRDERRASTSKRSRETEAEAVAFVVCQAIGLETGSAAQAYIQLYEGDAKLLSESLEHIQQTATRILNTIGAEGPPRRPFSTGAADVSSCIRLSFSGPPRLSDKLSPPAAMAFRTSLRVSNRKAFAAGSAVPPGMGRLCRRLPLHLGFDHVEP